MKIKFTKMHGLGNDFIVINNLAQTIQLSTQRIQMLADRHRGIGFDQLLMVEPSNEQDCDFSYRIFNADGSEVEQCGNGARCFAKFVRDEHLTSEDMLVVATQSGKLGLRYVGEQVRVKMGVPKVEAPLTLTLFNQQHILQRISIGNPHAVLVVEQVEETPVNAWGEKISHNKHFPQGVNVEFMQIIDRARIHLRVYERGVGETLACGSGACAAVAAAKTLKLLDEQASLSEEAITVQLPGGELQVNWAGEGKPIWLTGPAVKVFEGWLIE